MTIDELDEDLDIEDYRIVNIDAEIIDPFFVRREIDSYYLISETEVGSDGQLWFRKVYHSDRAELKDRNSDGYITDYANCALEYFNHRCALSGERFQIFEAPIKQGKCEIQSNLSAEHVVAIAIGGNDVIPNIVPSVFQYNIQKKASYILDWWPRARDINGNPIYSDEKLLKVVNFMLKSLHIRNEHGIKPDIGLYREELLKPNEIDEYLSTPEVAEKLVSDVITTTKKDAKGKVDLAKLPSIAGSKLSFNEQNNRNKDIKIDENTFIRDAIEVLEKSKVPEEIISKLKELYQGISPEIPFEIEVRNLIITGFKNVGIDDNIYTASSMILANTDILEIMKQSNKEDMQNIIQTYINKKIKELKDILPEEHIASIISINPEVIYDIAAAKEQRELIDLYIKYSKKETVDVRIVNQTYMINILKIKKWMKENNTTKPPRVQSKDKNGKDTVPEDEAKLGLALATIRHVLIKRYNDIELKYETAQNEEDRIKAKEELEEFKRQHPELDEVMAWVEELDRNNIPVKEDQPYYINMLNIKKWMKENNTTKPPRVQSKDKNGKDTVPEDEAKLGSALNRIKQKLIKPYNKMELKLKNAENEEDKEKAEEELEEFKRQHPELDEVMAWVKELDKNNNVIKKKTKSVVNEHKDDLASALDSGEAIEKEIELTVNRDKKEIV